MEDLKEGDKVRLKSLEDIKKIDEYCNGIKDEYIEIMQEKVYTIEFINDKYVKLLEDTKHFYFAISFLEKVPSTSFKLLPDNFSGTLKIEKGKVVEKIVKKEILDKTEKEYLWNIIKPFKEKVSYIEKDKGFYKNDAFIRIALRGESSICFPYFKKNEMYIGMKLERKYTVEELFGGND